MKPIFGKLPGVVSHSERMIRGLTQGLYSLSGKAFYHQNEIPTPRDWVLQWSYRNYFSQAFYSVIITIITINIIIFIIIIVVVIIIIMEKRVLYHDYWYYWYHGPLHCQVTNSHDTGYGHVQDMMEISNGNIFRVTGPLRGEFTGHRWIPLTKASDAEYSCFL